MSQLLNGFVNTTNKLLNLNLKDPRSKDYILADTIWPCFFIFISYLYIVYSLGPRLMKNRKPFKLEGVLKIYNALQIAFSMFIVLKVIKVGYMDGGYNIICQPVDRSTSAQALEEMNCVYLYYIAKITDLMDTVFFVLKKNFHQVSFLHVYHHAGMIFAGFIGTRYVPGGHAFSLGLVNSFVHAVMYSYYLWSAFDPTIKSAKWKKYITQMQMIQFIGLAIHFCFPLIWPCGYPVWPCAIIVPQYLFMFILFNDFYQKAYNKPSKDSKSSGKKE